MGKISDVKKFRGRDYLLEFCFRENGKNGLKVKYLVYNTEKGWGVYDTGLVSVKSDIGTKILNALKEEGVI